MTQIMAVQIRDSQFPEGVIQNRGRHLYRIIACNNPLWLKAGKGEGLYILFQRHAILQPDRYGNRKIIHQRSKGSAFFVHIDENFTQPAIFIFTSTQIHLMTANAGFLCIAFASVWQALAIIVTDNPLNDFFYQLWCCRHLHLFCLILIFFD